MQAEQALSDRKPTKKATIIMAHLGGRAGHSPIHAMMLFALAMMMLASLLSPSSLMLVSAADESNDTSGSASDSSSKPAAKDDFDAKTHTDWGSYYDPQNVFCGKFDCYRILGFDYEQYDGKNLPDTKLITKRYRSLSREWHPDKSKHKNAKERFVVRV